MATARHPYSRNRILEAWYCKHRHLQCKPQYEVGECRSIITVGQLEMCALIRNIRRKLKFYPFFLEPIIPSEYKAHFAPTGFSLSSGAFFFY